MQCHGRCSPEDRFSLLRRLRISLAETLSLRIFLSRNTRSNIRAQAAIEFVLLLAISVTALLISTFVLTTRDNAFDTFFRTVYAHITGGSP